MIDQPQQLPATSRAALDECREIPFQLVSSASNIQQNVPLSGGFCLPSGQVADAGEWIAEGPDSVQYPVRTDVLNRWSDGSVRWFLARFIAEELPSGSTTWTLIRPRVRRSESGGVATLSWAGNELTVRLSSDSESTADLPTESTIRIAPTLRLEDESEAAIRISSVTEEESGSVCCRFCVAAEVAEFPHITLQFRLELWPRAGLIRVDTRIRNSRRARHAGGLWDLGDAGSFRFRELSLRVTPEFDRTASYRWKLDRDGSVRESAGEHSLQVVQHGSGSRAWSNTNHHDANDKSTVDQRGFVAQTSAGFFSGHRAEPSVSVCSGDQALSIAVPEFWQQFPSALAVDGLNVTVGLFPSEVSEVFELQGGEQKTLTAWVASGAHAANPSNLDWAYGLSKMIPAAHWVKRCRVIPWLPESLPLSGPEGRYVSYLQHAMNGDYSVEQRRERIDEYGWRNFGDVHADHEQRYYAGSNTIISHYNNQFDLIFGGIQNLLVTGDSEWFDLFDPLARHVMDIDVYHTSEDRACFNGGLFWHTDHYVDARTSTHRTYSTLNANGQSYGGGPSNEHNYTTGLLYYFFLTGNPEARETVLTLADWVIAMDDGSRTVFGLFDSGDTGLASQTVFDDFHGPGRGAGNSINALLDAWILTREEKYLSKAEQLIRRIVHPHQDLDELHLLDSEGHWSYTVALTAIGRYLDAKTEAGQRDEMFAYARQTMQHYGRWMAANEKPALSVPDELEYVTEAWAAQDFRKANVLRLAAACADDPSDEAAMRNKADELNDAAWKDLVRFGNGHLTARCLSILMTEGLRDVFHRTSCPEYVPPAEQTVEADGWQPWRMFVPQKRRVKQMLRRPAGLVQAVGSAVRPGRIRSAIQALKEMM